MSQDIRAYLAWLRTDYKPHRFSGSEHPLAAKTVHNVWITLSSFFTWATAEFEMPNPMKAIAAPHFEKAPVEPFSKDDLEPLLGELKVVLPSNMLAAAMERGHSLDLNAVVQEWLDQPE